MDLVFISVIIVGVIFLVVYINRGKDKFTTNCDHDYVRGCYSHNQEESGDYVKCSICGERHDELGSSYFGGQSNSGFYELWNSARDAKYLKEGEID